MDFYKSKLRFSASFVLAGFLYLNIAFADSVKTGRLLIGHCCSDLIYDKPQNNINFEEKNLRKTSAEYSVGLTELGLEPSTYTGMSYIGTTLQLLNAKNRVIFFDGKIKNYNKSENEFSFGIASRSRFGANSILGFNVFRDTRIINKKDFAQNSFGAELFLNKLELRGNYYKASKKTHAASIKDIRLDSVILNEEYASDGFDIESGLRNKNFGIYAGFYNFDYNAKDPLKGFRARAEFLIKAGKKSAFEISPEFFSDKIRGNNFAVKLAFKTAFGKGIDAIFNPVTRDRDIIVKKRQVEKKPNKIILKADKDYKISRVIRSAEYDPETQPSDEDLLLIDQDFEIAQNKKIKNAKIAGKADLELYISSNGSESIIKHRLDDKGAKLTIKENGTLENVVASGVYMEKVCNGSSNMQDVTIFDSKIHTCKGDYAFKNDKDVKIINSKIEDNTNSKKQLFYSDEAGARAHNYTLRNVEIETKNELRQASLFGSADKSLNSVELQGKISVKSKSNQ